MSHNKKMFRQMVEESKQKKTIRKPKDRIVDPMGQLNYPGEVTRIPSNRITMQGVPYPVLGVGSNGQQQMMFPGQEYNFGSASYVDEYPMMKAQYGGGFTYLEPTSRKLPTNNDRSELATSIGGENGEPAFLVPSFKYGRPILGPSNDPYLEFLRTREHLGGPFKTWQEADAWDRNVRHPYVEKGQAIPTPIRRWGKDYTNQSSGEMPYRFFRDGGFSTTAQTTTPFVSTQTEDEINFQKFFKTLPFNLRVDSPDYNLRGYWKALGSPEKFDYSQPKEDDGFYHAFSRNPQTGEILKKPWHPTFKMAIEGDRKAGYYPIGTPEGKVKTVSGRDFKMGGDISIPNLEEGNWLDKYAEGGLTTTETTRPPIYTKDPRKVAAYQDSLNLYKLTLKNLSSGWIGRSAEDVYNYIVEAHKDYEKYLKSLPLKERKKKEEQISAEKNYPNLFKSKIKKGIAPAYWRGLIDVSDTDPSTWTNAIPIYKKPVQEYIFDQDIYLQPPQKKPTLPEKLNLPPARNIELKPRNPFSTEKIKITKPPTLQPKSTGKYILTFGESPTYEGGTYVPRKLYFDTRKEADDMMNFLQKENDRRYDTGVYYNNLSTSGNVNFNPGFKKGGETNWLDGYDDGEQLQKFAPGGFTTVSTTTSSISAVKADMQRWKEEQASRYPGSTGAARSSTYVANTAVVDPALAQGVKVKQGETREQATARTNREIAEKKKKEAARRAAATRAHENKQVQETQARIDQSNENPLSGFGIFNPSNWTRENIANTAIADKMRFFPDDGGGWGRVFDEYINPLYIIGSMADNIARAPLQAQQSNSYMPYVMSFGVPFVTGMTMGIGAPKGVSIGTGSSSASLTAPVRTFFNRAGKVIDKTIYPLRTYRVEAPGGNVLGYAPSKLAEKVFKKGDWSTTNLRELVDYTKSRGLFDGADLKLTEYKVPFWKKNITYDKDVIALKKSQGFIKQDINPNEYIIPRNTFFYPRRTSVIKAVPEHLKTQQTLLPSGQSIQLYSQSTIPFSSSSDMFASAPYEYVENQINAVTGHSMPLTYNFTDKLSNWHNFRAPMQDWKQPIIPQGKGVGKFSFSPLSLLGIKKYGGETNWLDTYDNDEELEKFATGGFRTTTLTTQPESRVISENEKALLDQWANQSKPTKPVTNPKGKDRGVYWDAKEGSWKYRNFWTGDEYSYFSTPTMEGSTRPQGWTKDVVVTGTRPKSKPQEPNYEDYLIYDNNGTPIGFDQEGWQRDKYNRSVTTINSDQLYTQASAQDINASKNDNTINTLTSPAIVEQKRQERLAYQKQKQFEEQERKLAKDLGSIPQWAWETSEETRARADRAADNRRLVGDNTLIVNQRPFYNPITKKFEIKPYDERRRWFYPDLEGNLDASWGNLLPLGIMGVATAPLWLPPLITGASAALTAPLTIGSSVYPSVTAGNILTAAGIANSAINATSNIAKGNYLDAATDIGWGALDVYGLNPSLLKNTGAAFNKAGNFIKNGPSSRVLASKSQNIKPQNVNQSSGLTKSDLNSIIQKQIDWLDSDEYILRRMASTGESIDQIRKSTSKWIKELTQPDLNKVFKISQDLGANTLGMYGRKNKNIFSFLTGSKVPYIRFVNADKSNMLNIAEHEIIHALSPASKNEKLYKNYPILDIEKPAKRTFFQDFFGKNPYTEEEKALNYLLKPYEQQVRGVRLYQRIKDDLNIPEYRQITENELSDWLNNFNKNKEQYLNEGFQDVYDLLVESNIYQTKKGISKKQMREGLLDWINKAWVVPAAVIGTKTLEDKKLGGQTNWLNNL